MAWMRTKLKVRKGLDKQQRIAVATKAIDEIVRRTQELSIDKKGKAFPAYSESYKKSNAFKFAGKSSKVDLKLSNEMMNSIVMLNQKKGEITIGFQRGDDRNNGVAEGNIKGTYGQSSPIRGKKRDFLGLPQSELRKIQDDFDTTKSDEARENLRRIKETL